MNLEEEEKIIEKAKSDPIAYGILYDTYVKRIFNFTYKRVLDFDLANDITSEVFLKGYMNIWRFRWSNISIVSWFYRIANNEINSYYRKKKYTPSSLEDLYGKARFEIYEQKNYLQEKLIVEKQLKDFEDFRQIQKIISTLPIKYQEVIALKYFEQKKIAEIASILGKKEGTVKSLLSRGIDKIRKLMK